MFLLRLFSLLLLSIQGVQNLKCFCDRSHFKRRLVELNYLHAIHKHALQQKGWDDHVNNVKARLYLLNAELDQQTDYIPPTPTESATKPNLPDLPINQLPLPSIVLMDNGDGTCEIDAYGKLYTYDIRPVCTVETGANQEKYSSVHLGPTDQLDCLGSFGYQCNTTLCNNLTSYREAQLLVCADVEVVADENDRQRNLYHYHRKLGTKAKSWYPQTINNDSQNYRNSRERKDWRA